MQIITTHKGADFDAAASVLAAKILYPEAIAALLHIAQYLGEACP